MKNAAIFRNPDPSGVGIGFGLSRQSDGAEVAPRLIRPRNVHDRPKSRRIAAWSWARPSRRFSRPASIFWRNDRNFLFGLVATGEPRRSSIGREGVRLDRDDESGGFGELLLIRIEGQEMGGANDAGGGDMEDVEGAVSAGEGVGGG